MADLRSKGGHFGLILPLCTSTATLGTAILSYPIFLSFQQAKPSIMGRPLSRFWEPFFKSAGSIVVATGLTSTISGLVCARWLKTHTTLETTAVGRWYTYGATFAALHFAFVPLIAGPIKRIIDAGKEDKSYTEGEIEEKNAQELKDWLLYHTVRTVFVDIPALICFAEGAAQSFWIV